MSLGPRLSACAVSLVFSLAFFVSIACGQSKATTGQEQTQQSKLAAELGFEKEPSGTMPAGWGGGPPETIFLDDKVVHGGRFAVRLERNANSANTFSTITKRLPMDFAGGTIELRGFLQTENVSDFAGLWMREDGDSPALAFDNMQGRHLNGTSAWTEYSISLPVRAEARQLFFGVLLAGPGKLWADDLQLLVDGKPIWEAPKEEKPKTILDSDHRYDHGSGIRIQELTPVQIANLAILGKIWGFLKYYHPKVTSGLHHWDYDLFRVMPEVLQAHDRAAANAVLLRWVTELGPVGLCRPCALLDKSDLFYGPEVDWITRGDLLGHELSSRLQDVRDNRLPNTQFYVAKAFGVGNPVFQHELAYADVPLPDSGFQLLSLFRFWNIAQYWSPNRNLLDPEWNTVLTEFIPRFAMARDTEEYKREILALLTKLGDGHANLWVALDLRPPIGKCEIPVQVRFVENVPVIAGFRENGAEAEQRLQAGDEILQIDGTPVGELVGRWEPYYSASNSSGQRLAIGNSMTGGECGKTELLVRRQGQKTKVELVRVLKAGDRSNQWHDLPGPAFRLLSKDIAYLKLSSVKASEAAQYVERATGTKGWVIDIRNYPSEPVMFALGQLLVDHETPFARFTEGDLSNPGAFHWTLPTMLHPAQPHYSGKIVILVDETSMSQAEYTTMAFRSAPGAIVVGSQTAGADGDVSAVMLPGGLPTMISGIGVFYPDKTPTQRIGIVPNVEVRPTIAGIRGHRDEVLEEAIRQIVGLHVPTSEIEKMAKPSLEAQ